MELPLPIKVEPEDLPVTKNDTNWNVGENIHTVNCSDVKVKDEIDRADIPTSCVNIAQDGTIIKLSTYSAGKKRNLNIRVPAPKRLRKSVIDSYKLVLNLPQTSTVVNGKECVKREEENTTLSVESCKQGTNLISWDGDNNDNLQETDNDTRKSVQMPASNNGGNVKRTFLDTYLTPEKQASTGQFNEQYSCINRKQGSISYNVRQINKKTYAIQINPDKGTAQVINTNQNNFCPSALVDGCISNNSFFNHGTMNKEKVKQKKLVSEQSHIHEDHTYASKANTNRQFEASIQTPTESIDANEIQLAIESETDGKGKYHVLKNATDRQSGIDIICGYCFGKFKTLKSFVAHFSSSCTRFKPGALPVLIKHDSCSNVRFLCAFCNVLLNSYLECRNHMSACARVVETFRMNGSYVNLEIFMSPECRSCHSTDVSKALRRFGGPHRSYIDHMMKVSANFFCTCKGPLDKFELSERVNKTNDITDDGDCDQNSSVKDLNDIQVQQYKSQGKNAKTLDAMIPTCSVFLGTHFIRFENTNSHAFTCGFCSLTAYNVLEFLPHIEHCQAEKKCKGLPYCISNTTGVSWWDGDDCVKAGFMCAYCIVRVSSFEECTEHMDHCVFADKQLPNVQFAVIPPCFGCHGRRITAEDRTDSMLNMVDTFRLIYDKMNKKFNICDTSNINHPCNQINKKRPIIKCVVLTAAVNRSATHENVFDGYTGDNATYIFETGKIPYIPDSNIGLRNKTEHSKIVHNANLKVEQEQIPNPDTENVYNVNYGINTIADSDNGCASCLTIDESKPNDSGKCADSDDVIRFKKWDNMESDCINGATMEMDEFHQDTSDKALVSDKLVEPQKCIIRGDEAQEKLAFKEEKHNDFETITTPNDSFCMHSRMEENKNQYTRKIQAANLCHKKKCRCFQKYAYHEVCKAMQTFYCGYCREMLRSYQTFFDHITKCRLTNYCVILPVRLAGRFFCGLCPVIYSRLCLAVHHLETCAKTFPCVDKDRTFGSIKIRLLSDRCFKHHSYIFNHRVDANDQTDEQFVLYQQAVLQHSTFNICDCNLSFKGESFNTVNFSQQCPGGQSASKRSPKGQKPFRKACCICAEKFTNQILYDLHQELHRNQSELCYICGYVNNSLRMRKHISSVHRISFSGSSLPLMERRKIKSVCHFCGKVMAYRHGLNKHLKYSCKSNKNRHKRIFKRNHKGNIAAQIK